MINEITTKELIALLKSPEIKIIDVRPVEAYNG